MSTALHWFRNDLRLEDNTALSAASRTGATVALYIATPRQWQRHDDAPIKIDFWRRNLLSLEEQLQQLGIPLLYAQVATYGDIPALLEQLLPTLKVSSLHCNREYPLNEYQRDQAVDSLCQRLGIVMHCHDDQMLLPPESVMNKSGLPFKVFTPYAKTARERLGLSPLSLLPAPAPQKPLSFGSIASCVARDQLAWPKPESHWSRFWPEGEAVAHQRLLHFTQQQIAAYKEQRDLPAVAGTSQLSHQLASGVLSVRQCWQATMQGESGSGIYTWQNELLWRDFYKQVMWHFPHVSMRYNWRKDLPEIAWRHNTEEFSRWCEGQTGIPIIDAAMRQLRQKGWMHNRLRMITAMFLSKHLLIDWRWGERWFMQNLVDGDFSANNGGWQWSASTGTDAAPYFRIFNPVTQSQRFDPAGEFIRQYVPELADLDATNIHNPGLFRPAQYPDMMLDLGFGRERALAAFRKK